MEVIRFYESDRQDYWLAELGKSDWDAGGLLHSFLRKGTFFDTLGEGSDVLLLVDGDTLISFSTFAKWDDIQPTDLSPWFGFVYTFPAFRGHRYVGLLFAEADRLAAERGLTQYYISTGHIGLYEKYGCTFLAEMTDWDGESARVYVRKVVR